jgi:DNA-binding transcriptional regulator YhcF (GntR family)
VISTLGPRARWVYTILRDGLLRGEFAPGAKLPSPTELAAQFGVAMLTVRHVLDHLEQEGLVSREHGRGTFSRARTTPTVLIVEDDPLAPTLPRTYVTKAGSRPMVARLGGDEIGVLLPATTARAATWVVDKLLMADLTRWVQESHRR